MIAMEKKSEFTFDFGRAAVFLNMAGIVLSGLLFPVLSSIYTPQPPWQDAALFVSSYHPLQSATFFFGYLLVIGSLMTFVALYMISGPEKKVWALSGLIINTAFTAVVVLNYIIQTTYVPYLAMNNPPETQSILPAFTMSNPGSFAWALEMYGWGGIGLSFVFMAFIFKSGRFEQTLKVLFIVNGAASVISALATSIDMNWLFTNAGLVSLVVWNTLVFIIDILLLKYFRLQKVGHFVRRT